MSPRHKSHHPSSTPRDLSFTTREERKPRKPSTTTSSIPTLPDVHKAPSAGPQGSFLHTLLAEDYLEEEEEVRNVPENEGGWTNSGTSSSRSVVTRTKGKVTQEVQGHRLSTPDRLAKPLPGETPTARSDRILTASWAGTGDPADQGRRGQRRRRSRDSGPSTRRLSGPLPSRTKLKHRLSHGHDPGQLTGSQRRYSSPAASGQCPDTKAVDLSQESEDVPLILPEESSSASAGPASDSANIHSDSEKPASESARLSPDPEEFSMESAKTPAGSEKPLQLDSVEVLPDFRGSGSDSVKIPSDPKTVQSVQRENSNHAEQTPSVFAAGGTKGTKGRDSVNTQVTPLTSASVQVTNTAVTSTSTLTSSTPGNPASITKSNAPEPSEPFNQWTSCRALEDTDDDNDDDFDDEGRDHPGTSETDAQDFPDGSMADGRLSRATSSNPTRRKRPLLLPPIMLPPLYTVKPTPLILRDDVYFAGAGSRARRPISDDEWDKLRDCRYLRIRTLRRPLKV